MRLKENMTFQSSVCLPYIGPASFEFARILRDVGIKVYHSSSNKLFRIFALMRMVKMIFRNLECVAFLANTVWFYQRRPTRI